MTSSRTTVYEADDERALDLDRVAVTPAGPAGIAPNLVYNGTAGNDTLIGDLGGVFPDDDTLNGFDGNDTLEGRSGNDVMNGGNGNDTIRYTGGLFEDAGSGETMNGGDGSDRLLAVGGSSNVFDWRDADLLSIEEIEFNFDGVNKFIYIGSQEMDSASELSTTALIDGDATATDTLRLWVNQNQNTIDASGFTFQNWTDGTDVISFEGDLNANTFIGSIQADDMFGGDGNDSMDGGLGNDDLFGGNNNDTLEGGNGNDTLFGGEGNDVLEGGGGVDANFGGNGNDRIVYNAGFGYGDTADGDAGVDTIDFSGLGLFTGFNININLNTGTYTDTSGSFTITEIENVIGSVSDETIVGSNASNTLFGGDGNDVITGLAGLDTVFGGNGDDTVFWRPIPGLTGTNGDSGSVYNGGAGFDTINAGNTTFGLVTFDLLAGTYTAGSFTQTWTSFENYTNNGTGTETVIGNNSGNTITTGSGNNSIFGGFGADTIFGGGGNDVIEGGFVTDDVFGGDGNDLFRVQDGEFYDNTFGGNGTDTLDHSAANRSGTTFNFLAGTITGAGINPASATLSSIEVYLDSEGSNTIVGDNDGGTYFGNGGNDVMLSGLNAFETMDGGTGTDTIDHRSFNGNYVFNMATGATNFAPESFLNFEIALMGTGNDSVTGSSADDTINGGGGNDTISGGAGTDSILGEDGNDLIIVAGGDGLDNADGGTGTDTLDYSGTNGAIVFDMTTGAFTFNGIARTKTNFENFISGAGNDSIVGTNGVNTIDGGGGNDTITAEGSVDSVIGGTGDDTVIVLSGDGVDNADGGTGTDTLDYRTAFGTSVNFNMQTGVFNFDGFVATATGFETYFDSDSTSSTITGTTGTETIFGGGGDDRIIAGDSSFGNGDVYDGGAGTDTMDYSALTWSATFTSDVVFNLFTETARFAGATETIAGFENFIGSQGGESIFGGGADQTLDGQGGNDLIRGKAGNDLVIGGGGDDTVNGGLGNDTVFGGDGDDQFFGKGGDDIMYGGAGSDVMSGALGDDIMYGGADDDILRGFGNDDFLSDGTGQDTLNGGLGRDTFDLVADGERDVIFDYKDGVDTIRLVGDSFAALTITTQVPGRVQILHNGGADELIVRDGGVGTLTAADIDISDFLFV